MIKKRQRQSLVENIDKKFKLEPYIKEAFIAVDREVFVTSQFAHLAYSLDALPLGASQWISSPLTVAKMTQYLEADGVNSILEVGCGSGYQAAILSQIAHRVFTIERINVLLKDAKKRFSTLAMHNIIARFDDGQRGWKQYAPFDRILFSATAKKVPDILFEQLVEGGILVAPIEMEKGKHKIVKYKKMKGQISSEILGDCLFVPILDGTQK